ncbi:hypothetical protein BN946_scf184724.g9 [Trametes cinnabarina]|uniref:Uncharacterized protein n=1 Tax=Pycnoporus cinnabarinus TaxID=5643 RepID=A0A060SUH3_PYCCI|nr:hypothetical protein BN946_scf184724.g9 [Trametes cinnabarina]
MVSVLAANLASTFIECTLYGIYLILAFTSVGLLSRRKKQSFNLRCNTTGRSRLSFWPHRLAFGFALVKSPLIAASILMIITNTVHWVITMYRVFFAVVGHETQELATAYINDLSQGLEVGRTALLFVDMLAGDLIITYRTWLVWRKDYRVIVIPSITISGLIASGIGLLKEFKTLQADSSVFASTLGPWILGYCIATLTTNLYGTVMIACKIYTINKTSKKTGLMTASTSGGSLMEGLVIFVESAALYSAWALFFVILYVTRSPLQTLGSGCGPTIIGISFTLITVRVGLGFGHGMTPGGAPRTFPSRLGDPQISATAIPMHPITLDISRTVEQEVDYPLGNKNRRGTSLGGTDG